MIEVRGVADPADLADVPGVQTARRSVALVPQEAATDPFVALQWSLDAVRAADGWQVTARSGLRIAVIDSAVDATHPELVRRVAAGWDAIAQGPIAAGADSDVYGHGTAVAGIAAASGVNLIGLADFDWGATIVPYRVFDASGQTTDGPVADAIRRAADDLLDLGRLLAGVAAGRPSPTPVDTSATCPDVTVARFSDTEANVHGPMIDCVAALGIAAGKGDGRYAPHELLTRGQIATFLVNTAAADGIVEGREPGLYAPGAPLLRAQMATFLVRALTLLLG